MSFTSLGKFIPRGLSTGARIKKRRHMYKMQHYSAINTNDFSHFKTFKTIILIKMEFRNTVLTKSKTVL
jgi:hypothetical protein